MGPVELLATVLAGAVIVLIYYYLMESGNVEAVRTQIYGIGERIGARGGGRLHGGVGEKVSGMGDRIMGKVRDVPTKYRCDFSNKIDAFLNEKSDELIEGLGNSQQRMIS